MIASGQAKGNKSEQTKRSAEGVVPLGKEELVAEESRWRTIEGAKLSVKVGLQAPGESW